MNSLGRLPREPSEGGATPFTGRRTKSSVITLPLGDSPIMGMHLNTENFRSTGSASTGAVHWHMSREEKNELLPLGRTWYLQPDTLEVHRALTELHVPLRHCLLAQRGTKRGRRVEFKSNPKVPSTRRSEENGKGQDQESRQKENARKKTRRIHHSHPNQAAICGHRSRIVPGPSSSATLKVLPPPHASGLSAEA